MTNQIIFLGFLISSMDVLTNLEKAKAITELHEHCTLHNIRSFHRLVMFYRHFIQNFNTLMTPITTSLKKEIFD